MVCIYLLHLITKHMLSNNCITSMSACMLFMHGAGESAAEYSTSTTINTYLMYLNPQFCPCVRRVCGPFVLEDIKS